MVVKVVIVDDHSTVRQGLQSFLELDPQIEVIGTAVNSRIQKVFELKPDVVLMDLLMPGMDGIQATTLIKREMPAMRVLVLTSVIEPNSISNALKACADGYILKSIDAQELCSVVKAQNTNSIFISPEIVNLLRPDTSTTPSHSLTEREMEVLKLVARGMANKEIANSFYLSEGTIKTHVSIILAKLNLQSRTQAALFASEQGWV